MVCTEDYKYEEEKEWEIISCCKTNDKIDVNFIEIKCKGYSVKIIIKVLLDNYYIKDENDLIVRFNKYLIDFIKQLPSDPKDFNYENIKHLLKENKNMNNDEEITLDDNFKGRGFYVRPGGTILGKGKKVSLRILAEDIYNIYERLGKLEMDTMREYKNDFIKTDYNKVRL